VPGFRLLQDPRGTDVLVKNVLDVQNKLRELRQESPGLFDQYLDPRLLDVPIYRVALTTRRQ